MFKKVLTFVLTKKDKNGIGRINIILGPFSICLVYPWYFLPALYNSLFNQSAPKTINWVPPDIFAYPQVEKPWLCGIAREVVIPEALVEVGENHCWKNIRVVAKKFQIELSET